MHSKHRGSKKRSKEPQRARSDGSKDDSTVSSTVEERSSIESAQGSNIVQPDSVRGERNATADFDTGVEAAHETARSGDERSHDGSVERPGE